MPAAWKTVRVFISSTFRDMHAERDHLVRVVFPELRERCAKRHLHLVDVDLRWGVPEEDAQRGKALEISLREIEDCRPYFIGLLGERYGWIPSRYDIPDEEKFDALRDIEPGHSITAMEIYHGVLNNPEMRTHAFFYFRDPAFIDSLPTERQRDFRSENDEHAEKLRKLKNRVRSSGLPVRENYRYDDLDAWGQQVLEDLSAAIQGEHPADAPQPDPLDAERAYHDFFIETRTELFIGQRHLLARLHAFASGDLPGSMVVTGTPGCGKSALLARFVSQFRRLEPEAFVLCHFVGASPSSTDPRQMLLRLCRELARRFGFDDEVPEDYVELRVCFWRFLQRAAERTRVVLVLDALNQLDETHRSHELDWLPPMPPPGLRLITSMLEGDALDAARRKYRQHQEMIVTSLRLVDQGFIVARQLQQARKRLTTARRYRQWRAERVARGEEAPPEADRSQLRYILTGVYSREQTRAPEETIQRETANPLYLKLVAEELRLFGDYDRLAEFIAGLSTDVPGMFDTVLDRLEGDHSRELVEHALSLVATGRHGLLEGELLELLARPGEERFPMALWSRLYRGLAFYFKPRASVGGGDEGLIDFFHQQLTKAVRGRYLETDQAQLDRHAELAGYFRRKGDPAADDTWKGDYPRSLSELVRHQIGGRLWDGLEKTLTTLPFLEANVAAGRAFDLAKMFSAAVNVLPESYPQRRILRLLEEALRRDIHFIAKHAQDYPQGLFQCLWNNCWWYDSAQAAEHYRPTQGDRSAATLPWHHFGPKLYELLEKWRRERAIRKSHSVWLRSIRPPSITLGSPEQALLRGHEGDVWGVACTCDGRSIISASDDKTLRIWDAESGEEMAVMRGHENGLRGVACSPDGRRGASGSLDATLRVWNIESGAELAVLRGHEASVLTVGYSPDGQRLASGSNDKTVRVWDAETGTALAVFRGHSGKINSVTYSPDGHRIVSGSDDRSVRVWDAASGEELAVFWGHEQEVTSIACSADGQRIVSGSIDKTIRVWEAATGAELAILRGHEHGVISVQYSPCNQRIVSGSADKTVRVWDAESCAQLTVLRGHERWVTDVAYSPSGHRIISGSLDGTVRLWDTESSAVGAVIRDHESWVRSVALSPDGTRIVSGSKDKTVRVWDAATGTELAVLSGHKSKVTSVAFSPNGTRIVSGSGKVFGDNSDNTVRIWDAQTYKELMVLRGHKQEVSSVAYSPNAQQILSGSADKTVRISDATSGEELGVLHGHNGTVTRVAHSPNGESIITSSEKTIYVWHAASGVLQSVLDGHASWIDSISYSPDGKTIVSSSIDDTMRVWNVETGECLQVIPSRGETLAFAQGARYFPLRALVRCNEVAIEDASTGNTVAFWALPVNIIVIHPNGRTWCGSASNHLWCFLLEEA